jgi:hypothetical protein
MVLKETVSEPTDSEWERLPRTSFDVCAKLAQGLGEIKVDQLFRNRKLNPNDKYVAIAVRNSFRAIFESKQALIAKLAAQAHRHSTEELEALIQSGRARSTTYEQYVGSLDDKEKKAHDAAVAIAREKCRLQMTEAGFSPEAIETAVSRLQSLKTNKLFAFTPYAVAYRGDTHFAATLSELPRTKETLEIHSVALVELGAMAVDTFKEAGALTQSQAEHFVDRLVRLLDKRYDRYK